MKRVAAFLAFLVLLALSGVSYACEVRTSDASYTNGTLLTDGVCDITGARMTSPRLMAGERLSGSATKSHLANVDIANGLVVSTTSAITIGGGVANDTYLKRIIVHAALTGTCVITGFADSAGTAQSFTIPAAFVGERNYGGMINSAGAATITCSNAADDNLVVVTWWPAS